MAYVEYVGPPGCGKTTAARQMLEAHPRLRPGRRSMLFRSDAPSPLRFGLPKGEGFLWLRLLVGLPRDLAMAARFCWDCRRLPSPQRAKAAAILAWLLAKSRMLARSHHTWVVDQGLQQHVLSQIARKALDPRRAQAWKRRCLSAPWAPAQSIYMHVDAPRLAQTASQSPKHRRQRGDLPPAAYAQMHVDAYLAYLALNPMTPAPSPTPLHHGI